MPTPARDRIESIVGRSTPLAGLVAVGVVYLLLQSTLTSLNRYFGWDEAVYYAQVAHGVPPIEFSASRSRGIAWLIQPLTWFGAPVLLIRVYLMLWHTTLLVLAYHAWKPLLGRWAVFAGAFFCLAWLPVYFAAEISPNLSAALLSVAGLALTTRSLAGADSAPALACLSFTGLAVMRPTDCVWVAVGMGFTLLASRGERFLPLVRRLLPAALGTLLGYVPWLVEAYQRFGGIIGRLRQASAMTEGTGGFRVFHWYLTNIEGPGWERVPEGSIAWDGVAWWFVILALSLVGIVAARGTRLRTPLLAASASAIALVLAYVLLTGVARPRYLLPAYALLALPATCGVRTLVQWSRARSMTLLPVALWLLGGAILLFHANALAIEDNRQIHLRSGDRRTGWQLKRRVHGRPCAFASDWGMPTISVKSGCRGLALWSLPVKEVEQFFEKRACAGDMVFAIAAPGYFAGSSIARWRHVPLTRSLELSAPPRNGLLYCQRVRQDKRRSQATPDRAPDKASATHTAGPGRATPNIVLVSMDTMRRDHLPMYGYARDNSPTMSRFAQSTVVFDNAVSTHTNTAPSHASMLTGQYPGTHGILKNGGTLRGTIPTLAEILKQHGYRTAAFISGYTLAEYTKLNRGFDVYDARIGSDHERRAGETWPRARRWLVSTAHHAEPLFLFLHLFDPHSPYDPPGRFADKFRTDPERFAGQFPDENRNRFRKQASPELVADLIGRYDGEIAYADDVFDELIRLLDHLGRWGDTLVILTSDHGETLFERTWVFDHGCHVYDEQVRVPLAIRFPRGHHAGLRVRPQVSHVDLLPTILALLDVERGVPWPGRDLSTFLGEHDGSEDREMFSMARVCKLRAGAMKEKLAAGLVVSVRTPTHKLIEYPRRYGGYVQELFDLRADPHEDHNLVATRPALVDKLHAVLDRWRVTSGLTKAEVDPEISRETEAALRSLGYVE